MGAARMSGDPHAALLNRVLERVLQGAGHSDRTVRNAAAGNTGLSGDLGALVAKVHAHAYRVSDEDVSRVQASHGDDRAFEIIVSAALGASRRRLAAGLQALDEACG
jgi:hypothetical protein